MKIKDKRVVYTFIYRTLVFTSSTIVRAVGQNLSIHTNQSFNLYPKYFSTSFLANISSELSIFGNQFLQINFCIILIFMCIVFVLIRFFDFKFWHRRQNIQQMALDWLRCGALIGQFEFAATSKLLLLISWTWFKMEVLLVDGSQKLENGRNWLI